MQTELPSDPVELARLFFGVTLKGKRARRLRKMWEMPQVVSGYSTGKNKLVGHMLDRMAFNRLSRKKRRKILNRARASERKAQ